jgi:hypothetical protein
MKSRILRTFNEGYEYGVFQQCGLYVSDPKEIL